MVFADSIFSVRAGLALGFTWNPDQTSQNLSNVKTSAVGFAHYRVWQQCGGVFEFSNDTESSYK